MKTPQYHPAQECLLAYANGCMGEAESLLLATHLAFCPECRKTARIGECVGSKIMEDTAVPVSSACRSKLFAALDGLCADKTETTKTAASPECFIPEPLRGYLGGAGCRTGVQQLAWENTATGQKDYVLQLTSCCRRRGAEARMIMLESGTALQLTETPHRRALLVLCGALQKEGTAYATGDMFCNVQAEGLKAGAERAFCLCVTTPPRKGWLQKILRLIHCG